MICITFEVKRKIKYEESNWRKREASGRNLQVEEGGQGEEDKQVDMGDEDPEETDAGLMNLEEALWPWAHTECKRDSLLPTALHHLPLEILLIL